MVSNARNLSRLLGSSPTVSSDKLAPEVNQSITSAITLAGLPPAQLINTSNDLPLSGNDIGDQVYVAETGRLYIWSGSGWYSIALINTSPAFDSGGAPESYYTLDSNGGTPITIQLSATDPEDIPIQWSYVASDSAQYFADITQDSSIFTITAKPTATIQQYDSDGGVFTITFKASDGINLATALSEFTISLGVSSYIDPLSINNSTILKTQIDFIPPNSYGNVRGFGSDINGYVYAAGYISALIHQLDINPMKSGGNAIEVAQVLIPGTKTYNYYMGICISIDGNFVYVADTTTNNNYIIRRYPLTVPYDISTIQNSDKQFTYTSTYLGAASFICISSDGTLLYVRRTGAIEKFILSTPWDISTASFSQATTTGAQDAVAIDPNGTKYLRWKYDQSPIYEYTMSTPHDLSTAIETATTAFSPTDKVMISGVYTTDGRYLLTHFQNSNTGELRQLT